MKQNLSSRQQTGRLITLEGIEGAGKSTHIQYISKLLTQLKIKHALTREPGGTRLGEQIRNILINLEHGNMDPMAELLLLFAARKQHITEVIQPYLKKGYWVLCDRFTDSSYAYQGGGRQLDVHIIAMLESWVISNLSVDLTFYFDISVATSASRMRYSPIDRFEIEGSPFMERVRAAYIKRISSDLSRFVVVNATEPVEVVQKMLKIAIINRFAALKHVD